MFSGLNWSVRLVAVLMADLQADSLDQAYALGLESVLRTWLLDLLRRLLPSHGAVAFLVPLPLASAVRVVPVVALSDEVHVTAEPARGIWNFLVRRSRPWLPSDGVDVELLDFLNELCILLEVDDPMAFFHQIFEGQSWRCALLLLLGVGFLVMVSSNWKSRGCFGRMLFT